MTSVSSSTFTFSMDVNELIEQALLPIGGEPMSGSDMVKARKVLNLLLIQLQNKNIPISKIDTIPQTLTAATATYVLATSVSDVLSATIKRGTTETLMTRYGVKQYQNISNKTTSTKPSTYMVERLKDAVSVTLWPVPDLSTDTVNLLVVLKIEDITAAYQRIDLPVRYLPLITKWLSYELAINRPAVPDTIKDRLKREYMEVYVDTVEEDKERVDFWIMPGGISGR